MCAVNKLILKYNTLVRVADKIVYFCMILEFECLWDKIFHFDYSSIGGWNLIVHSIKLLQTCQQSYLGREKITIGNVVDQLFTFSKTCEI